MERNGCYSYLRSSPIEIDSLAQILVRIIWPGFIRGPANMQDYDYKSRDPIPISHRLEFLLMYQHRLSCPDNTTSHGRDG